MTQSFEESPTGKAFAAFQAANAGVDKLGEVTDRVPPIGPDGITEEILDYMVELLGAAILAVELKRASDMLADAAMSFEGVRQIDGIV